MAGKEMSIPLKVRQYNRVKSNNNHQYESLILQIRKSNYLLKGESEDECRQIMANELKGFN
jgi:hypothetical protein